jgi:hypothetical protein
MPKDKRGGRIFNPQYHKVDTVDGIKVITLNTKRSMSLPKVAGRSRMYILENATGERKKIGIYDSSGHIAKEIHFDRGHTNRPKSGKTEYLKRGVAHVHNVKGGWGNNVRYMTKREIKKYGNLVIKLGGKVSV